MPLIWRTAHDQEEAAARLAQAIALVQECSIEECRELCLTPDIDGACCICGQHKTPCPFCEPGPGRNHA